MSTATRPWANRALLFIVLALSALTMIWLFWHYPVKTAIGTILLLCAFVVAARLARWMETDAASDLHEGKQT